GDAPRGGTKAVRARDAEAGAVRDPTPPAPPGPVSPHARRPRRDASRRGEGRSPPGSTPDRGSPGPAIWFVAGGAARRTSGAHALPAARPNGDHSRPWGRGPSWRRGP